MVNIFIYLYLQWTIKNTELICCSRINFQLFIQKNVNKRCTFLIYLFFCLFVHFPYFLIYIYIFLINMFHRQRRSSEWWTRSKNISEFIAGVLEEQKCCDLQHLSGDVDTLSQVCSERSVLLRNLHSCVCASSLPDVREKWDRDESRKSDRLYSFPGSRPIALYNSNAFHISHTSTH